MSLTTAIAIYFLIWWITLFGVLPFGIRSQHESGDVSPGTDPGAPTLPRIGRTLIRTTIAATVIFAFGAVLYSYRLVTIDGLASLFGF